MLPFYFLILKSFQKLFLNFLYFNLNERLHKMLSFLAFPYLASFIPIGFILRNLSPVAKKCPSTLFLLS